MREGGTTGRGCLWRLALWLFLSSALLAVAPAQAQDVRYLRVGTGPPGESHFPLGGLIASAISNPPGLPPCGHGGGCGLPGLIAVASATSGSVANVEAIALGQMDAALVQSDVPLWAARGLTPFGKGALRSIRSVANLAPDDIHLVALRESTIRSPRDLKGKRVSLGEIGSGTLAHARLVLAAWGLKESDIKPVYMRSALAAGVLAAGSLDAFFVVDGIPVPSVAELAKTRPIRLVPLTGPAAEKARHADALLAPSIIPAGTYEGLFEDVPTLRIGVSLVVSASLPNDLVYGIAKALWQPETLKVLAESRLNESAIAKETALAELGVPLHPGAEQFYADAGMLR